MNGIAGMDISQMRQFCAMQLSSRSASASGVRAYKKTSSSSKTKKKKSGYSYHELSDQILHANTSLSAGQVVIRAKQKLVDLYRKKYTGDYDEGELNSAILHVKQMERIARKRKKHLKEEEALEHGRKEGKDNLETEELTDEELEKEDEKREEERMEALSEKYADEMQQMMQELEELEEEMEEEDWKELEDVYKLSAKNMSAEDIKELRKKHRAEEYGDLVKANLRYLKTQFDQLEQSKRSGVMSDFSNFSGVSLEIGGSFMQAAQPSVPVAAEAGGSIDIQV